MAPSGAADQRVDVQSRDLVAELDGEADADPDERCHHGLDVGRGRAPDAAQQGG